MAQRLIDANAIVYDFGEIDDGLCKRTEFYVTDEAIAQQPTIDAVPLDGSFLKMSKGEYLIYNRHWLYEHFDQEIDIQRSAMKSMGYEYVGKNTDTVRHGKWIKADSQQYFRKHYPCFTCSECGYRKDSQKKWNYCPNCGARMDKE